MLRMVLTQSPITELRPGKVFELTEPRPYVLGCNEGTDISISAPQVLPNHLQFEFQGQAWTAKKLDEAAVVKINGLPVVGEHEIGEGDRIGIGGIELTVTKAEEPEVDPEKTWVLNLNSFL